MLTLSSGGHRPALLFRGRNQEQFVTTKTGYPEIECPCGSKRLLKLCHGAKDGVPLHPRQSCLCEGKKKRGCKPYKDCCLKRGYYLRETLQMIVPPRIIEGKTREDRAACKMIKKLKDVTVARHRAAGLSDEEISEQPVFAPLTGEPAFNPEEHKTKFYSSFLPSMVSSGEVDPAYAFAVRLQN